MATTSVRSILASHISEAKKSMKYDDKVKLTQRIRAEIKENIGHGISEEYYDSSVWKADTFKPQFICGHIVNAFLKRGAYANKNETK